MTSLTIFSFLLFVTITVSQDLLTPGPDVKVFRKDYKYEASTEYFYKFHKIPLKFQDAVNLCKFEGAELAVPKTEGEATILRNHIPQGVKDIWVGLHDIYAEGDFVTLDGKSIDDVYSNWNEGEPNNINDDEDCVLMVESKRYNDIPCDHKRQFICFKPESSVSYNWLCETYDKDYFYNIEGDRCYKLHSTPRTWHEAFKICRAEEATMAVVNSETEAKFLSDTFNKEHPVESLPGNFDKGIFFLDFSDLITPGVFVTSEGKSLSEVGYDKWAPWQPDNQNGVEHCGSMFRSGELNDANCNARALFYCEKVLGAPPPFATLERVGYKGNNSDT